MVFVTVTLIILTCIAISYLILSDRRQKSSVQMVANILPGPKTWPFIGSINYFCWKNSYEILDIAIKLLQEYSSPFKFWVGNKLFIAVYEPDQMQAILQNSVDKSIMYKIFEPILGSKGLITAPASIWIKNRKIIAPCFNTNVLRKYFGIFVDESLMLTDKLEKMELNENEIIYFEHISKCTMNIACGTMTDVNTEVLSNQINQIFEVESSIRKTIELSVKNYILHCLINFNFVINLIGMGREQRKNKNLFHSFIDKLIQRKMYALNEKNAKIEYETNHRILLDVLIKEHKDKYPQEIHDNLCTIIMAGFETTAVTINFVIFMLGNFPEIQEKVYKELWEIYGTKTPKSTLIKYEDLQRMDYLDCVIKETMRIFPAIPFIARYLTKDVKIGELILPKGVDIILSIIFLHRNEKYWPNPLVFDPDRFLPERKGTSPHYYMPFGLGPRNCIGLKYAMISMKVILATLIRTFIFKVDKSIQIDKIKLKTGISLSSVEPLKVKFGKRDLF